MTTINIGTNRENIVKVKIDKPFKDINYSDIFEIAKNHFKDKPFIIQGWADVSRRRKTK